MNIPIPDLVTRLGSLLHHPPTSVEIIPGDGSEWLSSADLSLTSYKPFIFLESNLGVPQKVLYKAYLLAVPLFTQCREHMRSSSSYASDSALVQVVKHTSAVLLLTNPAHQTALNARKKLVIAGHLGVQEELTVTAALLTVQDAAKQSILWYHRRWLFHHAYPCCAPSDLKLSGEDYLATLDIPPDAFRTEFELVSRACETYPRNYYAWAHRHQYFTALLSLIRSRPYMSSLENLLLKERAFVRTWIERHVSDYTAMQYLCALSRELVERANTSGEAQALEDRSVQHACDLLKAYPNHEALWMYLRGILVATGTVGMRVELAEVTRGRIWPESEPSTSTSMGHAPLTDDVDSHVHAVRFLAWQKRQIGITRISEPEHVRWVLVAGESDRGFVDALLQ